MGMVIQTNVSSMEAQKNLLGNQANLTKSFNRLSSGFRINTAADDAAGLAISESMKSQIRSYTVARDLGLAPTNAHVGVIAEFDDEAAFGRYREHPAHVDVVERLLEPVARSRTALQFEV